MDLFTGLRITLPSFSITIFCDRIARLTLTRVLGLPQSTEINLRPDRKCRQGFTGAPAAAGGRKNKWQVPLLAPQGGASTFLIWGGKGYVQGLDQEGGWLRWSTHPIGGVECRRHVQYPEFAPSSSEVATEFFWSILLSIICPNGTCTKLFLVP